MTFARRQSGLNPESDTQGKSLTPPHTADAEEQMYSSVRSSEPPGCSQKIGDSSREASLREEEPAFESEYSQHSSRSKNKLQKQPPVIAPGASANDLSDEDYSSAHSQPQNLSRAPSSHSNHQPTQNSDPSQSQFNGQLESLGSVQVGNRETLGIAPDDSIISLDHYKNTAALPVDGPLKVD